MTTGRLRHTNAGHNPPYLLRPGEPSLPLDQRHGPVVAALPGSTHAEDAVQLGIDDVVLLCTDGVTESMDADAALFSDERLATLLSSSEDRRAESLVRTVLDDVRQHQGEAEQADDITLLAVRNRPSSQLVESLSIDADIAALPALSGLLEELGRRLGLDGPIVARMQVVLDDIVSNVVNHAFADDQSDANHEMDVSFEVGDGLLILEVSDHGRPFDPTGAPTPDTSLGLHERLPGGLGLHLVTRLHHAGGTTPGPVDSPAMVDLPPRVRLVVLFGGRSAEHDISCISARHVLDAVDPGRYEVVPMGITRDGAFTAPELAPGDTVEALAAEGTAVDLLPVLAAAAGPTGDAPAVPTVVLPILHGPNGEDGTVQGLLEVAGVAYVGAGVLASSVAMDKAMAKVVLAANGIPQVRWHTVAPGTTPGLAEARDLLEDLGPTLFVKPANMGSSIGVHKVNAGDDPDRDATRLLEALADARRYDDVVVIEQGVEARELECAVLGNLEPRASVVGEVVTEADFYDYDDKYFDGTSRTIIPAEVDAASSEAARALAVTTFRALRCEGMARVDMFAMPDGSVLVNEVNTIPGFTPISMYPKLWEASGLGYAELIDELVRLALERHASRSARSTSPR